MSGRFYILYTFWVHPVVLENYVDPISQRTSPAVCITLSREEKDRKPREQ